MTVRWGICGTGRIAQRFCEQLRAQDDAEVVAVASRTPGRAEEFAAGNGIPRAHLGYAALAGDDEVDVVYVATTQEGHRATVIEMLAGGRHVLCEKPLAMTELESIEMIGAAVEHGRFLMEAMWSRFSPAYRELARLIDEGCIGEVLQVRADLSLSIPEQDRAAHRLWDRARGGGALLDIGIYPLNLASFVLGEPSAVRAVGLMAPGGVDQRVAMLLEHPGGAVAVLTTGLDLDAGRDARVTGSSGSITLGAPMHAATRLTVERTGDTEVFEFPPPGLGVQVPEVHRCLAAGLRESPIMPWSESRSLLRTADIVRAQIAERDGATGSDSIGRR